MILLFNAFIISLLLVQKTTGFSGTFWHICDLHLNNSLRNDSFGNYKSDSSISLITSALKAMVNINANPEFIIVNGDNVYHGNMDKETFKSISIAVTKEINFHFPKVTILPTLGNHDLNPANYLSVHSDQCRDMFDIWSVFLLNLPESDIESFKKGCFYTRSIKSKNGNVFFIIVNTMLWYSKNYFVANLDDPLDQFVWLENKLWNARQDKIKVFLAAHVPPGASEYTPDKFQHLHPQHNQRFVKLIQDYADIIDAGFFAHQHTDAFKIVYGSQDVPLVPLFQSPSISPVYLWYMGSVNPSFRLYVWNETSSQSKYLQYHTLLNSQTNNGGRSSLNWTLEYDSTSMMHGLSASQLNDLVTDLSNKNSVYFNDFFNYHLSGYPHDDKECPQSSMCRCRILCGLKNVEYPKLNSCINYCPRNRLVHIIVITVLVVFIVFIVIFVALFIKFQYRRQPRSYRSVSEHS